jgi:cyanophycin synthetase
VIIDYCHNVDGMRKLTDFVERMMVDGPVARSGATRGAPTTDGGGPALEPSDRRSSGGGGRAARRGRALGVIGIPGDRRNEDQIEYGALAAASFDELIVREDKNLRGRPAGEAADNVIEGIRRARTEGHGRATRAEKILEELAAVRAMLRRAMPGDLVVMCVDDAVAVYREAMAQARRPGATAFTDPGELSAPLG